MWLSFGFLHRSWEKWVFEIPDGDNASLRGAAYWPGDGSTPAAIIFGTRRGRMYSISAATGRLNTEFGVNGMVDLKTPEVMKTGMDKSYILPSPPTTSSKGEVNLIITGAGSRRMPVWRQRWRRRPCRRHARLGCEDRQARLDLPLRASSRRGRTRYMGRR